ncbi:MAG: transcriptional regulator [Burkholderiales bacterium]
MAKLFTESLLEHERFEVSSKSGGGLLSYEIWGYRAQGKLVVTRYNLAWINHSIHQGDNGRVLGFDNAHGYHHRHFMGRIEKVDFVNFEATQERFQREWREIVKLEQESIKGR